jgi:hypothetical protein
MMGWLCKSTGKMRSSYRMFKGKSFGKFCAEDLEVNIRIKFR